MFDFDAQHGPLFPYMVAANLSGSSIPGVATGLARLSACVAANWRTIQVEDVGLGGRVRITYNLTIIVNLRYGDALVFTHVFDTPEAHIAMMRRDELGTFDPSTDPVQGKDPYALMVRTDKGIWEKLSFYTARRHTLVDPARRAAVATVSEKMKLVQRAFYAGVAQRFTEAGDPIQMAGQRLTGSRLLWQSFVTAGLPLSVEANEVLRSLLFGSDAILAGSDAEDEDNLLDVADLYRFMSAREEDPFPANILDDVEALNEQRVTRLLAVLAQIVADIEESGEPEPPELFAPTLLRLSLL